MDINRKDNSYDIILFLLLLSFVLLYFYRLGAPSIWNPNEAFYAETPREMLEKGDYLTPYFNYGFRFEKPVLMYWLVLPFYRILGINETAVRMVSALAAAAGVFITYRFGAAVWKSRRAGLISAALLASAFDYNSAARYASPEMVLTFFITASIVVFYKWYNDRSSRRGLWRLLFYGLCGLSTLTKGPVGIILPAAIIAAFLMVKKDLRTLKSFVSPVGLAVYLAMTLPWYLYMLSLYGKQFSSVVLGENLFRFLTNKSGESSFFYYFTVLPWNFLPGAVFIIPAFLWMNKMKKSGEEVLFPLIWFAVVFLFFSFSKSKLPPYIYPLFPAAATLVGGWIATAIERDPKAGAVLVWLSALLLLVISAAVFWLRSYLPDMSVLPISLLIVLFASSIWNIRKKIYMLSLALFLSGMAVFYLIFLSNVLPQIEKYRPYREMAAAVKLSGLSDGSAFYCSGVCPQSLTFYLERKISAVRDGDELDRLMKSPGDSLVLLDSKTYEERYSSLGKRVIWEGPFYEKSESQFMKFLLDIRRKRIGEYVVVR